MQTILLLLLILSIIVLPYFGFDLEIKDNMSICEKLKAYIKYGIAWLCLIYISVLSAFLIYMKCTGKISEPEIEYDEEEFEDMINDPMRHVPSRYQ